MRTVLQCGSSYKLSFMNSKNGSYNFGTERICCSIHCTHGKKYNEFAFVLFFVYSVYICLFVSLYICFCLLFVNFVSALHYQSNALIILKRLSAIAAYKRVTLILIWGVTDANKCQLHFVSKIWYTDANKCQLHFVSKIWQGRFSQVLMANHKDTIAAHDHAYMTLDFTPSVTGAHKCQLYPVSKNITQIIHKYHS